MDNYLGEIRLFAGSYAPQDWAFCNGAAVNIADNAPLFSLLGITYGGDGITTFHLPDLQGLVVPGTGHGNGLSNYVQGQRGGTEAVALTAANIPAHTHEFIGDVTLMADAGDASTTDPTNAVFAKSSAAAYTNGLPGDASLTAPDLITGTTTVTGSGVPQPHDNLQPFLAINYIIALNGIWPSRQG